MLPKSVRASTADHPNASPQSNSSPSLFTASPPLWHTRATAAAPAVSTGQLGRPGSSLALPPPAPRPAGSRPAHPPSTTSAQGGRHARGPTPPGYKIARWARGALSKTKKKPARRRVGSLSLSFFGRAPAHPCGRLFTIYCQSARADTHPLRLVGCVSCVRPRAGRQEDVALKGHHLAFVCRFGLALRPLVPGAIPQPITENG